MNLNLFIFSFRHKLRLKYESNLKKTVILIISSILLFCSQYTTSLFYEPGYFGYASIFLIGIITAIVLLIGQLKKRKGLRLNIIDLCFLAFVFVFLVRGIGTIDSWIFSKMAIALALVPTYFFIKQFKFIHLILWGIVINGCLQIAVSVIQLTGLIANTNSFFKIGGTFGNPNVLAMMLLMSVTPAYFLFHQTQRRVIKRILIVFALSALAVIVLTRCRTAILGSLVTGVSFLLKNTGIYFSRSIKLIGFGIAGTVLACFIYLMNEKSESLSGRLLIWQASLEKISEKPLWGHGISSFHRIYPQAQKEFLENNLNDIYKRVADSPKWAYNDFIELWLEGGIFVMLTFLLILLTLLYCWGKYKHFNIRRNNAAYLSAIVFFILSVFNFAYTAWPVLLIFVISLAWSSRTCRNIFQIRFNRKCPIVIIAFLLLIGNFMLGIDAGNKLLFQSQFKKIEKLASSEQNSFYAHSKEKYSLYAPFAFNYAAFLNSGNNRSEALKTLQSIHAYEKTHETSFHLAEFYRGCGDFENARTYYQESIKYIPNRIMPLYNLYMIERLQNNHTKADSIREIILKGFYKGDPDFINHLKITLMEQTKSQLKNEENKRIK